MKEKILVLEKSLQQIVYDFEKEKELLKYQHEAFIRDQRQDIVNLGSNLKGKNRELKQVRALSQVMLSQRSEVEQFFLEALEQIKEEIRKKIAVERKQKKQEFGGLMRSGQEDDKKVNYSEKVDLNDLDWEDRERVLRLLFSKMNAGVPGNAARVQAMQLVKGGQGGHYNMQGHHVPEYGDADTNHDIGHVTENLADSYGLEQE